MFLENGALHSDCTALGCCRPLSCTTVLCCMCHVQPALVDVHIASQRRDRLAIQYSHWNGTLILEIGLKFLCDAISTSACLLDCHHS